MLKTRGISLIETVIYVAILAVIFLFAVNMIFTTSTAFGKARVRRNINEQGTLAMERIIREIRLADDIESPGCAGSALSELKLKTVVSSTDSSATTRKFFLENKNLMLQEGTSPQAALTSGVKITNLAFRPIGGLGDYYVRKSGSDTNNGRSPAAAFLTIAKAASLACAGETVYVGAGTYNETGINPTNSGTAGNIISFIADTSGSKTGDAGSVLINGNGQNDSIIRPIGESYLLFDGFIITNSGAKGVLVKSGASNVTIQNIITHANAGDGLAVNNVDNVEFINNLSYENGGDGIELDKGRGVVIRNNTFYSNGDRGIRIEDSSRNVTVQNNLITENALGGIKLAADSTSGYSANYNLNNNGYQISASPGPNDINADPRLVDPNGADNILGGSGYADDKFQLSHLAAGQSSNSPAIDAGSDSASNLSLGGRTTRTDNVADSGTVDIGWHYALSQQAGAVTGIPLSKAVKVEFKIEGGSGRFKTSQKFYGTAVLRRSYK